jgi:uncharacterized membrane protein required for colicin V production
MEPIEISFLILIAIFGLIGLVRGFNRELGVTTMLFAALAAITLLEHFLGPQLDQFFSAIAGPSNAAITEAVIWTIFLVIIVFISYQGETLAFPGGSASPVLGLLLGLLNGYLFADTIFYFWSLAGWPFPWVVHTYDQLYAAMVKLAPVVLLPWWFFVTMLIIMLIARVLR